MTGINGEIGAALDRLLLAMTEETRRQLAEMVRAMPEQHFMGDTLVLAQINRGRLAHLIEHGAVPK